MVVLVALGAMAGLRGLGSAMDDVIDAGGGTARAPQAASSSSVVASAQAGIGSSAGRWAERFGEAVRGAPRAEVRSVKLLASEPAEAGAFGDVLRAVRGGEISEEQFFRFMQQHGGVEKVKAASARITTPDQLRTAMGKDALDELERMFDGIDGSSNAPGAPPWLAGDDAFAARGRSPGVVTSRRAQDDSIHRMGDVLRSAFSGKEAAGRVMVEALWRARKARPHAGVPRLRTLGSASSRPESLADALQLPGFVRRLEAADMSLVLMDFGVLGRGELAQTRFFVAGKTLFANTSSLVDVTDGDILRQLSDVAERTALHAGDASKGEGLRSSVARMLNAETPPSTMLHVSSRTYAQSSDELRSVAASLMDQYAPELTELMALAEPQPVNQNDSLARLAAHMAGTRETPPTRLRVHLASFRDLATRHPQAFGNLPESGAPALFDRGIDAWNVVLNTDRLHVDPRVLREELGHVLTLLTTP